MKRKRKLRKGVILFLIFFGVFVFSIFKMSLFFFDMFNSKNENAKLVEQVLKVEKTIVGNKEIEQIQIDFEKLLSINSDTIGWIKFNDGKVNYPVVKTMDNDYYLKHSFNRQKSSYGAIFMDYNNTSLNDHNVVLYGHNTFDNSMFGSLKDVINKNFFDTEENRIIEIIDLNNVSNLFKIFSYYTIEKENYYIKTSFSDELEFQEFVSTIKDRSYKKIEDVNISYEDSILTLSTCSGFGNTSKRMVIHAKLIK